MRLVISKQAAKDSPTAWKIIWLGIELDTRRQTIAIPEDKITNKVLFFRKEIFSSEYRYKKEISTSTLEELIGVLCHFSQT